MATRIEVETQAEIGTARTSFEDLASLISLGRERQVPGSVVDVDGIAHHHLLAPLRHEADRWLDERHAAARWAAMNGGRTRGIADQDERHPRDIAVDRAASSWAAVLGCLVCVILSRSFRSGRLQEAGVQVYTMSNVDLPSCRHGRQPVELALSWRIDCPTSKVRFVAITGASSGIGEATARARCPGRSRCDGRAPHGSAAGAGCGISAAGADALPVARCLRSRGHEGLCGARGRRRVRSSRRVDQQRQPDAAIASQCAQGRWTE